MLAGYTNYCDRQLQFDRGLGISYPFLLLVPPPSLGQYELCGWTYEC